MILALVTQSSHYTVLAAGRIIPGPRQQTHLCSPQRLLLSQSRPKWSAPSRTLTCYFISDKVIQCQLKISAQILNCFCQWLWFVNCQKHRLLTKKPVFPGGRGYPTTHRRGGPSELCLQAALLPGSENRASCPARYPASAGPGYASPLVHGTPDLHLTRGPLQSAQGLGNKESPGFGQAGNGLAGRVGTSSHGMCLHTSFRKTNGRLGRKGKGYRSDMARRSPGRARQLPN